jgi:hypothetical protein
MFQTANVTSGVRNSINDIITNAVTNKSLEFEGTRTNTTGVTQKHQLPAPSGHRSGKGGGIRNNILAGGALY